MEKITVAQIKERQEQISKLSDARDNTQREKGREISILEYDIYREKIRAIERERDAAIESVSKERDAIIDDIDSQINDQYRLVAQAKRIMEFLKLDTSKNLSILDEEIELSRWVEQYQEALGYLYDNDYLKIKAFIIGNRKPKNKYSLIVVGKSIFPEELIKYPYSYGIDITNWRRNFALQQIIKESSSIVDLKNYYAKHKGTILKETITEYESVKAEYAETIQTYTIKDFAELVTWRCPQCASFCTIFDSFAIHYTPQCYKHEPYIDMVKSG